MSVKPKELNVIVNSRDLFMILETRSRVCNVLWHMLHIAFEVTYKMDHRGYQGFDHWMRVLHNSRLLVEEENVNLKVVELACTKILLTHFLQKLEHRSLVFCLAN